MAEDQIALWISEYPRLAPIIESSPKMRDYLATRKPKRTLINRADQEKWNEIVKQLDQ